MLHNAVVLYRSTITFSYTVSTTSEPRLCIPSGRRGAHDELDNIRAAERKAKAVQVEHIRLTLG